MTVAAKRIAREAYVAAHQDALERGERVLLFQDECFLLWGDLCGYAWGKRNARVTMPVGNLKARQTFYGGIDAFSGEMHLATYPKAESAATPDFLSELMYRYPTAKLTMCWDNARWHRGEEVCRFLETVNAGLAPEDWRITRIAFAPHDPEQNPIEAVWHQGKTPCACNAWRPPTSPRWSPLLRPAWSARSLTSRSSGCMRLHNLNSFAISAGTRVHIVRRDTDRTDRTAMHRS